MGSESAPPLSVGPECEPHNDSVSVHSSALGAAGVALVETEIQLYTRFQPARPTYDIGVDLRALNPEGNRGANIQVKASAKRNFNVQKRWETIPNFLVVYVWQLQLRADAIAYVLTYEEAFEIVKCHAPRWLETRSWSDLGGYGTTSPSNQIRQAIHKYRATPERWRIALAMACITESRSRDLKP
jgi:hypothetical protein